MARQIDIFFRNAILNIEKETTKNLMSKKIFKWPSWRVWYMNSNTFEFDSSVFELNRRIIQWFKDLSYKRILFLSVQYILQFYWWSFCKIFVKRNLSTSCGNIDFKSVFIYGLTATKAKWVYHNRQENHKFNLIRDFVMSTDD